MFVLNAKACPCPDIFYGVNLWFMETEEYLIEITCAFNKFFKNLSNNYQGKTIEDYFDEKENKDAFKKYFCENTRINPKKTDLFLTNLIMSCRGHNVLISDEIFSIVYVPEMKAPPKN